MDSAGERIALARALHDGLAQDLVALRFRIEHLAEDQTLDLLLARELKRISREISEMTEKVRQELFDLRELHENRFMAHFEQLFERHRNDIPIYLDISPELSSLDHAELFIHITEELIRNTLAHAGASRIDISITQSENLLQYIFSDNGCGGAREGSQRYGLTGIRESVELKGGRFEIIDKNGTTICLNFPNEKFL